jgi:homoserine kinase
VGFDVLGMALEAPGDIVTVGPGDAPGVTLRSVSGDDGVLPRDPERNCATVAAAALLERAGADDARLTLDLQKGLPLASGMGGSAASSVAAVVATDAFLGLKSPPDELLRSALVGERAAAGAGHPDNAAPSLLGGIVLSRVSGEEVDLVPLPTPEGLHAVLVHPALELRTAESRAALPDEIPLATAVAHGGDLATVVAALHSGDLDLLSRALVDHLAEPFRAPLIPGFSAAVEAARRSGALAATISGGGPSVFALARSRAVAQDVGRAMVLAFREAAGVEARAHVSRADAPGARVVSGMEPV